MCAMCDKPVAPGLEYCSTQCFEADAVGSKILTMCDLGVSYEELLDRETEIALHGSI